jgi:hypothetical protein
MRPKLLLNSLLAILALLFPVIALSDSPIAQNVDTAFEIKLENGTLSIQNHPLPLPQPIDEITPQIGPYTRFSEKANDIYTWDNHGFILWSQPGKKTIFEIGVYIRKKKPVEEDSFSPTGRRFVDSRPKRDFSGTFILDGVEVTPTMTFETLNARKSGEKFNRTHWADQFKYYSTVPGTGQSYRVIVYLHEDRTISSIEIVYEGVYEAPPRAPETSKQKDEDSKLWEQYRKDYGFTDQQLAIFKNRYQEYQRQQEKRLHDKLDNISERLKSGEITEQQAELEFFEFTFGITTEDFENYKKAREEIERTKFERSDSETALLGLTVDTMLIRGFFDEDEDNINRIAAEIKAHY